MVPQTTRLYNPKGPDRLAVVSVQPSAGLPGGYLIQLARGSGPGPLGKGTVYGPYPEQDLEARFADVLEALNSEGFRPTGVADLLVKLASPDAAARGRAALGLGWRRAAEAVEPILAALPKAVDEICSFLDALGALGDRRALPVLREQAVRKLLSRRRSAVEALRNLGDSDGLAAARQQALERLPAAVRQVLEPLDPEKTEDGLSVVQAILALEVQQRGLALDTLYELATPLAVAVVPAALAQVPFDQAHHWRYVKSIHKRAMLRHDYALFGWLSHAIEVQGRASTGSEATVKSGYDGVVRPVRIFARKTQNFMRRLSWRYLRLLASHRPEAYSRAAAEALLAYGPQDGETPRGLYGQFASCYLLNRILWGGGQRFELSERSLRFRFRGSEEVQPPAHVREEAYPHLWDAQPRAYLRILGAARLVEAHAFAVQAVESRHPHVLHQASPAEILAFLQAPYEPTVKLGLKELERRFDPEHPDWLLLGQLLSDGRPAAREMGERWLRLTAPLWTGNLEQIVTWLAMGQAATRALATQLTVAALRTDAALRPALAKYILDLFLKAQVTDDTADGFVTVAREVLLDDLDPLLSLEELIAWIGRGPEATLAIAGELLGRRRDPLTDLGLERLVFLAQHDIATVRAGAHRLIRGAEVIFRADPSLLLMLVESAWEDTRKLAVEILRVTLRPETLTLEGLMGLLDSSQVEVQNLGQELVPLRLAFLPADELVYRLVQHPHPNMRRFALEMALRHLPEGANPLARLEHFFRAALFDLWPDRLLKQRVLDFLARRGLADEYQAAVAARILAEVVRVQGRGDFERALEALVRLKLAYPQVAAPITLKMEDVA